MNTAQKTYKTITPGKIKALQTMYPKAGLTREEYDMILAGYDVQHTNHLYDYQAKEILETLSKILKKQGRLQPKTTQHHNTSNSAGLPSPALPSGQYKAKGKKGWQLHLTQPQADRIEILKNLLGWNSPRLQGFIKQQLRIDKGVEMLMNYEARKIIIGMQRILSGSNKAIYKTINTMSNQNLGAYND